MSGLAELMSISLLKPSPSSRNVRSRPAPTGGSAEASKLSVTSSPGFETTKASSAAASSGAHVALPRVAARHGLPGRQPRDPRVVEAQRLPLRRHGREAALAEVGAHGVEGHGRERHVRRRGGDRGLVPVDAHRRDDADPPRGPEPAREVDHDRLRPAHRDPDLLDGRHPGAVGALDLEARRHGGEARLVSGHVVAREGVVGPAGQEQDRVRRRQRGEVEGEGVLLRVPADALERQVVHEHAVRRSPGARSRRARGGRSPAACAGRAPRRGGTASAAPSCPRRGRRRRRPGGRRRGGAGGRGTAPPRARS